MLIGIESERANHPQKTGVEHYARQLILHLAKTDRQNKYRLYLRTNPEKWFFDLPKNFQIQKMPFPFFWTQLRISWEMLFRPVDVLLIPASALPFVHPQRSVVTVHDVAWRYFPQGFTWFMRNFLEWSTKFALKRAWKIIAVSEATKKDLIKFYAVDEKKIEVIYHGVDFPASHVGTGRDPCLPEHYVLFLSTLQPRKNLEGLIDAFLLLKKEMPNLPHKLVVAGKKGWKYDGIMRKMADNEDIVIYLGHVEDEERWPLQKNADLLVLPSFYEGFGMTVLEAFAANVPAAVSNVSSLPEVAGDAAVYFNPKNPSDIARAMKMVLFDKTLADSLRQKGLLRLKNFSWEKCAEKTLKVLENDLE